jgi:hypothetical protein
LRFRRSKTLASPSSAGRILACSAKCARPAPTRRKTSCARWTGSAISWRGARLHELKGIAIAPFTYDQHQLPIALPRTLPAPHQHRHLLVATDEWREMALPGAASAAAGTDEPEQRHWLRHAF